MKFFLSIFLAGIFIFISVQAYNLHSSRQALTKSLQASTIETTQLSTENEQYRRTIEFNTVDQNLIKEAQTKYNVHKPGEQMYILIPSKQATSS